MLSQIISYMVVLHLMSYYNFEVEHTPFYEMVMCCIHIPILINISTIFCLSFSFVEKAFSVKYIYTIHLHLFNHTYDRIVKDKIYITNNAR